MKKPCAETELAVTNIASMVAMILWFTKGPLLLVIIPTKLLYIELSSRICMRRFFLPGNHRVEDMIDMQLLIRYIPFYRYGGTMREFIKVMKALSDPNRVKIVKLLQRKVMCVCEIQEALGLAQSTASKHLKILEDSGLIAYSKEGARVNYRLDDGSRNPYAATLLGSLKHWLDEDIEVAALVDRLPEIRRELICGT